MACILDLEIQAEKVACYENYGAHPNILGQANKPALAAVPCFVLASHMNNCELSEHYALTHNHTP